MLVNWHTRFNRPRNKKKMGELRTTTITKTRAKTTAILARTKTPTTQQSNYVSPQQTGLIYIYIVYIPWDGPGLADHWLIQ